MDLINYSNWYKEIVWLQDKVILPNGNKIPKSDYILGGEFDYDSFNKELLNIYNKQNK